MTLAWAYLAQTRIFCEIDLKAGITMNRMISFCAGSLLAIASSFGQLPGNWPSEYPVWWYDADPAESLIDTSKLSEPQNDSILLQGQLLWMADRGIAELDQQLAPIGGAGFTLGDLRDSSRQADYDAVVVLGQLKLVASKFMDRFAEIGFQPGEAGWPSTLLLDDTTPGVTDNSSYYPWLDDRGPQNLQPALLGQAKHLFSWDISQWASAIDVAAEYAMPYAYLTNPAASQNYTITHTVSLAAVADFPDEVVDQVTFFVDNTQQGASDSTSPYGVTWSPSAAGMYILHAVALGDLGGTVETPRISILVQQDGDSDGLGDDWESLTGIANPNEDNDGDGILASEEYRLGTSPNDKDNPQLALSFFSVGI